MNRILITGKNSAMPKLASIYLGVRPDGTEVRMPVTLKPYEYVCRECDGTGEKTYAQSWHPHREYKQPCPECEGEGIITVPPSRGVTTRGHLAPPVSAMLSGGASPIPGSKPGSGAAAELRRTQKANTNTVPLDARCRPQPSAAGTSADMVTFGLACLMLGLLIVALFVTTWV